MIKTVLGNVSCRSIGVTLPHEHICCYSEYLYSMVGKDYINKEELLNASVKYLKKLKSKYGLNTFIDCTPVNIGRNVELLKRISEQSGVNIICSTGFYYTYEPLFYNISVEDMANYIIADANNVNAGIIKCAIEIGTTLSNVRDFDLPDGHGAVHQPYEYISVAGLLKTIEITALMLLECDNLDVKISNM